MFKDKKSLVDVAVEFDIETHLVLNFRSDYPKLVRMHCLVGIYQDLKDDLPTFFHLYRRIKEEGLSMQDISDLFESQQRLVDVEKRVKLYSEHIHGLQ